MSRIGAVLLVVISVGACTAETTPSTTLAAPSTTTTTTTSGPSDAGRLVVVDEDGRVVVVESDGSDVVEMAASTPGGAVFGQPIWSTDGTRVSYAKAGPDGFAYVIQDLAGGELSEVDLEQFPFYASWAPDGTHLGLLRNGDTGVVFELLDVAGATSSVTDTATPFYFSWRPEGGELVSHAGANRLLSRDSDGLLVGETTTDSEYLAPQWLDRGVLHIEAGRLVIDPTDGDPTAVASVTGPTSFIANRQGTKLAALSISNDPAVSVALSEVPSITPNTVSVVDIETGDVTVASDAPAIAFFWSPDGVSLLMLSLTPDRSALVASVWSDGETREYATYLPHPAQVRDVFPFFPQYAQSMSYWSGDSSAFALVGAIDDEPGIWVQGLDGGAPVLVSDGSWAAWAP